MSLLFLNSVVIALAFPSRSSISTESPTVYTTSPDTPTEPGYCSVLNENFASGKIDPQVWRHDFDMSGMGNGEFEMYTDSPANSFVQNSTLYLKPSLNSDQLVNSGTVDFGTKCTSTFPGGCKKVAAGQNIINPVSSARLSTINSVTIKRGKVEVVAKLPSGDWLWPAIWLLPKSSVYGTWPRSGEIDIMESYGNKDAKDLGPNRFGSTLHWGPTFALNSYNRTHEDTYAPASTDFAQGFHTYGLIWTKDRIITYVDDPKNVVLNTPIVDMFKFGNFPEGTENPWAAGTSSAPFDQEFYLLLNLAVGGTGPYFPDGDNKPWNNASPTAMSEFWKAKDRWHPTWSSPSDPNSSAMAVKSVKMWTEC